MVEVVGGGGHSLGSSHYSGVCCGVNILLVIVPSDTTNLQKITESGWENQIS